MTEETHPGVTIGDGYAAAHLDDLGDGPGFRKIRTALGVTAFGVNAIVLPPGYDTGTHAHETQEELYIGISGECEMYFADGTSVTLGSGDIARVDAATIRGHRNKGTTEAVYVCAGGKDGYVGRDGIMGEPGGMIAG